MQAITQAHGCGGAAAVPWEAFAGDVVVAHGEARAAESIAEFRSQTGQDLGLVADWSHVGDCVVDLKARSMLFADGVFDR